MSRHRDPERLAMVAALPCIVCGASPVEVHHIKRRPDGQKYGMGQRAGDDRTIPLCPLHHRLGGFGTAFHAGPREFEKRYGDERRLLFQTDALLALERAKGSPCGFIDDTYS